jgi:EAL domain-containing protein (putative c-di-GMP-specific phosphodiesterase class I)
MVERALDRGDTKLAFQPAMRADGTGAMFYEGLIRVLDDTGRIIPARDFMGNVEERDLGRRIDCAALVTGLRTLKSNPGLRLAINMSARSIGYPKWMGILRRFSRNHPDVVERLILEITETSAMQMPEIVTVFMEELRAKGVTFALDDFGAGDTAFRHLKHFCFDILKIDGQYARGVDQDPDNQVVTEALISLGHISTCWSSRNPSKRKPKRNGWPKRGGQHARLLLRCSVAEAAMGRSNRDLKPGYNADLRSNPCSWA